MFTQTSIIDSTTGVVYNKFSTSVDYMSSTSSEPSCAATCYVAIRSLDETEPPENVCDVEGNDFQFQDENLMFHISTRYG